VDGGRVPRQNPIMVFDDAGSGRSLRFGVVCESAPPPSDWLGYARRVEDVGVDVLLIRDHFVPGPFGRQPAPWTALAAAAAATTRLQVGTMVLSNDYRHPALVAHEAATLYAISGGRFELGLGAGWYRPEYDAAGIPFDAAGRRIDRLEESLDILTRLFAGGRVDHHGAAYTLDGLDLTVLPQFSGRPPIAVGAGGPRMLRLAGRYADIVGLLPAPIRGAEDPDDPEDRLPAAFEAKRDIVRSAAGDRFPRIELSAFGTFVLTSTRRSSTEDLIASRGWSGVTPKDVWQMPTIFVGDAKQIREDLVARRDRYGLTYLLTSDKDLDTLSKVIVGL
jgi:probable F420-dependent oxidoreductase